MNFSKMSKNSVIYLDQDYCSGTQLQKAYYQKNANTNFCLFPIHLCTYDSVIKYFNIQEGILRGCLPSILEEVFPTLKVPMDLINYIIEITLIENQFEEIQKYNRFFDGWKFKYELNDLEELLYLGRLHLKHTPHWNNQKEYCNICPALNRKKCTCPNLYHMFINTEYFSNTIGHWTWRKTFGLVGNDDLSFRFKVIQRLKNYKTSVRQQFKHKWEGTKKIPMPATLETERGRIQMLRQLHLINKKWHWVIHTAREIVRLEIIRRFPKLSKELSQCELPKDYIKMKEILKHHNSTISNKDYRKPFDNTPW